MLDIATQFLDVVFSSRGANPGTTRLFRFFLDLGRLVLRLVSGWFMLRLSRNSSRLRSNRLDSAEVADSLLSLGL